MSTGRSRLARLVTPVFLVLVAVFIVWYLRDVDVELVTSLRPDPVWIGVASGMALASRYWGVVIWRTILRELGATELPSFAASSDVYARAWLGRYIPGKVAWIAGKVYFASEHGVSRQRLAVSSIVEAVTQLVSIMVIALVVFTFDERADDAGTGLRVLMVSAAVSLACLLIPSVMDRVLKIAGRIMRREVSSAEISGRLVAVSLGMYGIGFVVSGASYAALSQAFTPLEFADVVFVMTVFNVAGAIGIIAFFAPSGLGVREGVQLVLLPGVMLKETALVITAVARIWSTIIDLAFAGSARALWTVTRRRG